MLTSFIVPVYNTTRSDLERCVLSILSQDLDDLEILIINDGSTSQETLNCIETLKQTDGRIQVVNKENGGLGSARNIGNRYARGKWLVHVDADDWITPDLNSSIEGYIINSGDVDIILWGYNSCKSNKTIAHLLKDKGAFDNSIDLIRNQLLMAALLECNKFENLAVNTTWGKAYRREFIEEFHLNFDEDLKRSQDVAFNLYAFEKARSVGYIDKVMYNYNLLSDSASRKYNPKTTEYMLLISNACLDFSKSYGDSEVLSAAFEFGRKRFVSAIVHDLASVNNHNRYRDRKQKFIDYLQKDSFKEVFERSATNLKHNKLTYKLIQLRWFAVLNLRYRMEMLLRRFLKKALGR